METAQGLTTGGWIMMTFSIGSVLALTIYCFAKVFSSPCAKEHLHAPLEIDTDEPEK